MRFAVAGLPGQDRFGAVVTGLASESIDDPATRKALYDLWIDKGIVAFRGMDPTLDTQIRLSGVFGELMEHPMLVGVDRPRAHRLISEITYDPAADSDLYVVDGKPRGAWLPWHSDQVYMSEINRGGLMAPVTLPAESGETGFIDQIAAYEGLPRDLAARIEGLHVVYLYNRDPVQQKFGLKPDRTLHISARTRETEVSPALRSRSIHPMVYRQKETGRKVLNVSPWFAYEIEGLEGPEGDALLGEVIGYCTPPELAYHHHWEMGDMVLWDNWRMLHAAAGVPPDQPRRMVRTMIQGDYGLGRWQDAAKATVTDEMRVGV